MSHASGYAALFNRLRVLPVKLPLMYKFPGSAREKKSEAAKCTSNQPPESQTVHKFPKLVHKAIPERATRPARQDRGRGGEGQYVRARAYISGLGPELCKGCIKIPFPISICEVGRLRTTFSLSLRNHYKGHKSISFSRQRLTRSLCSPHEHVRDEGGPPRQECSFLPRIKEGTSLQCGFANKCYSLDVRDMK